MLLDAESDPTIQDENIRPRKKLVDASIMWIIVLVAVAAFFLLTLLSMGRVQKMSDLSFELNRPQQIGRTIEIGEPTNSASK